MRHQAIIVSCPRRFDLVIAKTEADRLKLPTSDIVTTYAPNAAWYTFLIATDGRYGEPTHGDSLRTQWKMWATDAKLRHVYVTWVHVSYADESGMTADHIVGG